jgi:hypothetical protein
MFFVASILILSALIMGQCSAAPGNANRPKDELPKIIEFFLEELRPTESTFGQTEDDKIVSKIKSRMNRHKKLFLHDSDNESSGAGGPANSNTYGDDGSFVQSTVSNNADNSVAERLKTLKKYIKSKSDKLSVMSTPTQKKLLKNEYRHIFIG